MLNNNATTTSNHRLNCFFFIFILQLQSKLLCYREESGRDTPQCWLQSANRLIGRDSELLNQVKQCIIQYTFTTRGEQYAGI